MRLERLFRVRGGGGGSCLVDVDGRLVDVDGCLVNVDGGNKRVGNPKMLFSIG